MILLDHLLATNIYNHLKSGKYRQIQNVTFQNFKVNVD